MHICNILQNYIKTKIMILTFDYKFLVKRQINYFSKLENKSLLLSKKLEKPAVHAACTHVLLEALRKYIYLYELIPMESTSLIRT